MPKGFPEGFEWLTTDPEPPRFSGYPAEDTPVVPTYRDYPTIEQTGGLPFKTQIPLLGYAEHIPKVMLGRTVADVPGLVEPGTIDLTDPYRPTQDAFHIEDGGLHVVLPNWGSKEAMIAQYKETGANFGMFKDEKSADDYAKGLSAYSELGTVQPYGLGVVGENQLGVPTRPKTGRKNVSDEEAKLLEQGKAPPESQESIKASDRQVGMVESPNIDLDKIKEQDLGQGGDTMKETLALNPVAITDPKKKNTVLIPTIIDGKQFPIRDAIRDYQKTGKHLGVFDGPVAADEYKRELQARQANLYGLEDNVPTQLAEGSGGRPELAPNNLAPGREMPFDTQAPQADVPDVASNRGLLASTSSGVPEGFQWLGADAPEAQTVNEPSRGGGETEHGLASTFGYNDPEDNGVGAWGDITNDPNAFGVSLPTRDLRRIFGHEDAAYGALVEVHNPKTGATVTAPILDKGPANWVINRQGPTIDITEGVRRELGHSGERNQWSGE